MLKTETSLDSNRGCNHDCNRDRNHGCNHGRNQICTRDRNRAIIVMLIVASLSHSSSNVHPRSLIIRADSNLILSEYSAVLYTVLMCVLYCVARSCSCSTQEHS